MDSKIDLRIIYIACVCKEHDIINNLLDKDLINESTIKELINYQHNKCIYCQNELKFGCNANDPCLGILERKNSNIGHIRDNCQLTCFSCALK